MKLFIELFDRVEQADNRYKYLLTRVIPNSLMLGWTSEGLEGYGKPRAGKPWQEREKLWNPAYWLSVTERNNSFVMQFYKHRHEVPRNGYVLPVFESYLRKCDLSLSDIERVVIPSTTVSTSDLAESTINIKEQNSMKNLTDYMAQLNTKAAKTTASMATGRAANQAISNALARSFPWYSRLMGKHKEVTQNPLARLGTAEAVAAAVKQFAPENRKLKYVAEAMVEEAMVDVAINSEIFKSLINQLESLADNLPTGE